MVEGKPMFVATEVAAVLGYKYPANAVQNHCKHAKLFKVGDLSTLNIPSRGINMIPESDVYRLIIRSKLPAAQQFEEWVMEVVLPVIRQVGAHIMGEEKVKIDNLNKTKRYPPPLKFSNKGQWAATVGNF